MPAALLTPAELARRAEAALLARDRPAARLNGAAHQDEPPEAPDDAPPPAAAAELPVAPIDLWFVDGAGLTRWRPVVDRVSVVRHPDGSRTLVLTGGYKLKLDPECAAHLGRMLLPAAPPEGQP